MVSAFWDIERGKTPQRPSIYENKAISGRVDKRQKYKQELGKYE
ncbi:hypothetical protein [Candidatus Campylobacter infans]|nr:hypothetical protein [Candidatus Campylobacter infans]